MANGWNVHFLSSAKGVGTHLGSCYIATMEKEEQAEMEAQKKKKNAPF